MIRSGECDVVLAGGAEAPVLPMAVAALKKGAYDFFEKPFDDNDLIKRVLEAMAVDARRQAARR